MGGVPIGDVGREFWVRLDPLIVVENFELGVCEAQIYLFPEILIGARVAVLRVDNMSV